MPTGGASGRLLRGRRLNSRCDCLLFAKYKQRQPSTRRPPTQECRNAAPARGGWRLVDGAKHLGVGVDRLKLLRRHSDRCGVPRSSRSRRRVFHLHGDRLKVSRNGDADTSRAVATHSGCREQCCHITEAGWTARSLNLSVGEAPSGSWCSLARLLLRGRPATLPLQCRKWRPLCTTGAVSLLNCFTLFEFALL